MNFEQQEWIDDYLFGELEGEELLRFETKMNGDADFREEVRLQKEILSGIQSYFIEKPEMTKLSPISKLVWIRRGLSVAAMITLIIMGGIMFQNIERNLKNTQVAASKIEISTNQENCESEAYVMSSTILAMASFNSNCRVPAFSAPEEKQDKEHKYFYSFPFIFDISA